MPRRDYKTCRECGRHANECGPITWARYCAECGQRIKLRNIAELRAHSGPFAERHRRACVAAWGGIDRDDVPALLEHAARHVRRG